MKWLQQKWYDVSIRTKSILLMGMMLAVTWVLVALVMIQLHTFSERSSVIMDEYMDITGFMDAFSAENASLEAYMRPIQPIDAKEDYLAAIQMTNRCLEELCPDLQADRREEYALKRAIRNAMSYYRESQHVLLDAEKPSEMIEHYLLLKTQSFYIDGYTRDLLHSQMVQGGMQWQEIDRINARSSKQFVAFLIVATVLMGLTLVVFKRSILAPLAALGQAADAISAGHYEAPPVVVRGDDELGRTAKSFNLMQAESRHTIWALEKQSEMEKHLLEKEVEAAQMQKKLQEGRFAQLQSQINPHFLFNTLSTIAALAHEEQAPLSEDLILRLSNFFRYSLESDEKIVALGREIGLLRDYMELQETRYGDRITMEVHADPALHQRGIVGMKDTCVHHIVNRADGILLLTLAVQLTMFDILEHAEQLTRDDTEALARICIAGKCIRTILHRLDSCKAVAANGGVQIKRMRQHQLSDFVDNCTNLAVQLANIRRGVNRNSPAGCVVCQCLPKRFHNADVVNY